MPLEQCSKCGGTEFDTDTYTGNIGLYCKKCRKGFDHFACTCGEVSWIDSIHLREKAPPTVLMTMLSGLLKAVSFPVVIILKAVRHFLAALGYLLKLIMGIIKYPFRKMSDASGKIKISREEEKKFRTESEKWTEIFYQRNPGWIGSGFPARALYELECSAEKGNRHALRSLEAIFKSGDGVNKARAAQHLKKLTGKDYMPQTEIDLKIRAANTIRYPLPPAPDDLP